jgi:NAD(P)-dependent dehydrogenase (short-subunit alcohol dehydrogenase family)
MTSDTSHEPPPVGRLLDLAGTVAIVTGASRGIGAGIAERLAQAGADVAVAARAADDGPGSTVARIRALGRRAVPVRLDVRDAAQVAAAMDATVDALGRLDILVNCAGVQPTSPLTELSADDWDALFATNARGAFLCTREAARVFVAQGGSGVVVNVASIEGLQPAWGHSHYSASKAAVIMHTRAAALELGAQGIRVNAVSPGLVCGPDLEQAWPDGIRRWLAHVPLGRMGRPDDVADAVLYLASPMARFVSGTNLVVDGGILTHPTW